LRIGPACEAGLSAGMRRERVSLQIRKKERRKKAAGSGSFGRTNHDKIRFHLLSLIKD